MRDRSATLINSVPAMRFVPATLSPSSTKSIETVPVIGAYIDVLIRFSFASLSEASALVIANLAASTSAFATL
jgi:hypothetical protein